MWLYEVTDTTDPEDTKYFTRKAPAYDYYNENPYQRKMDRVLVDPRKFGSWPGLVLAILNQHGFVSKREEVEKPQPVDYDDWTEN